MKGCFLALESVSTGLLFSIRKYLSHFLPSPSLSSFSSFSPSSSFSFFFFFLEGEGRGLLFNCSITRPHPQQGKSPPRLPLCLILTGTSGQRPTSLCLPMLRGGTGPSAGLCAVTARLPDSVSSSLHPGASAFSDDQRIFPSLPFPHLSQCQESSHFLLNDCLTEN